MPDVNKLTSGTFQYDSHCIINSCNGVEPFLTKHNEN